MAEDIKLKDEERQKCEVWTRVMGYHRPVEAFNIGKQGEHEERKHFDESITCADLEDDCECEAKVACCCGCK